MTRLEILRAEAARLTARVQTLEEQRARGDTAAARELPDLREQLATLGDEARLISNQLVMPTEQPLCVCVLHG